MTDWLPLAQAELDRLPYNGDKNRAKKVRTIIALVNSTLDPTDSPNALFYDKPRRQRARIVSRTIWTQKWSKDPLIASILENILKIAGNWYDASELKKLKDRQDKWRELAYTKALLIDEKTTEMLNTKLFAQKIEREVKDKDGRVIHQTVHVFAPNWSKGNVAPLMSTADKLARMALDMPTNSTKQAIDQDITTGGEPLPKAEIQIVIPHNDRD